ncbi:MAG: NYN domain-containing protein [bacterium]
MSRVCVFIDGSNLYFALKRNNKMTRVDYYQFSLALTGSNRNLIRTYYYNAVFDSAHFSEKAKSQQSFFDSLDRTPYLELRLGRIIQNREGHRMEKGVDVRMASDMVYYAARDFYDTAVVVTEDQDFAPAIALVKELGKHVELALFPDAQSREMVRVTDKVVALDEVVNQNAVHIFPASQNPEGRPSTGNDEEMAYGL